MPLILNVDTQILRAHLAEMRASNPGLVPVIKGNGYGYGKAALAREAAGLGVDTIAVGQYDEVADVSTGFAGSMLVLTPWRPFLGADLTDTRLIHTVSRLEDLQELVDSGGPVRVALERGTSMLRHGMAAQELARATTLAHGAGNITVEGLTIHLPLEETSHLEEARSLLIDADLGQLADTLFVSHLTSGESRTLEREHPGLRVRLRTGTELWLDVISARRVTATVLDVHHVERGQEFGYRSHRARSSGSLLIVSGGTSHGIGLESIVTSSRLRERTRAAGRGILESLGYLRSPYFIEGRQCLFAEPPHMQVSLVWLPQGVPEPTIGDTVDVRIRETTTDVDEVRFT